MYVLEIVVTFRPQEEEEGSKRLKNLIKITIKVISGLVSFLPSPNHEGIKEESTLNGPETCKRLIYLF
jgi:hypothetical protein